MYVCVQTHTYARVHCFSSCTKGTNVQMQILDIGESVIPWNICTLKHWHYFYTQNPLEAVLITM